MSAKKMGTYFYNTEILKLGLRLTWLFAWKTLFARVIPLVDVNVRNSLSIL